MQARVRLWNRLVELEHSSTADREQVLAELAPDLVESAAVVKAAECVGEAAALKTAKKAYAEARRAAFVRPAVKERLVALEAGRREAVKAVRQEAAAGGLYWCNVDDVTLSYDQARRGHGTLAFHAWRRERGKLSVRWQQGLSVVEAFGNNTLLQIGPVAPGAWLAESPRGERRRQQRTTLRFRVASLNRKPVWLTLPIALHRPLVAGALIRSAAVFREQVGAHDRWKVTITMELPAPLATPRPKGSGTIGIDLGWRRRYREAEPIGIRIAMWQDDHGRSGEVLLAERWLTATAKVEDIRSIRDKRFNAARVALQSWLEQATVPDWLVDATSTLAHWRSPARLADMMTRWRESRFGGDEEAYSLLEEWRRREKHLFEYEANLRDKLLHARRDQYRCFAAWVAGKYGEVRLEQFDLRPMADLQEEGGKLRRPARSQRVNGAPSELRLAIEHACRREGVVIVKQPAQNTTRACHICGYVDDFDAENVLEPTCPACGVKVDQDLRAAINLLHGRPVSQMDGVS